MLRAARERQGIHLDALASQLKVTPHKLELLEADRYDEIGQGHAFVRALAKTACRLLKIDPEPVLSMMPALHLGPLDKVSQGLNTPYRERDGGEDGVGLPGGSAIMTIALVLVVAAGLIAFLPDGIALVRSVLSGDDTVASESLPDIPGVVVEPVQSAPGTGEVVSGSTVPDGAGTPSMPSAPGMTSAPAAPGATAPADAGTATPDASASDEPLQIRATSPSWIEVRDGNGKVLLGRTIAAGETVNLDGQTPLRVRIGNVAGTEINYNGKAVDLSAVARNNLARIELE